MEKKENQRITLTKRLLKESFIHLMEKKSIQKISISEICKDSGINRATFYNHYNTQFDLLTEIEDDMVAEIKNCLKKKNLDYNGKICDRIEVICTYLKENEEIAKLLFINNSADSKFASKLFQIPKVVEETSASFIKKFGESGRDLLITFLTNGAYNMIRQWLIKDIDKTPKEMGELVSIIIINSQ